MRLGRSSSGNRDGGTRCRLPLESLQVGMHLGSALVAHIAIFFERLVNEPLEFHRKLRIQTRRQGRGLREDRVEDYRGSPSQKWSLARRHLIQNCSKGKQIRARVHFLTSC